MDKQATSNVRSAKVYNLTVPSVPQEQTRYDLNHQAFSRFGSDNLFPQALIQLARNSSVHRGIINNKTTYVVGDGVFTEDAKTANALEQVNAGEDINELLRKLVTDWHFFGNAYLELVMDARGSFLVMRANSATLRTGKSYFTIPIGKGSSSTRAMHSSTMCSRSSAR